MKQGIRKERLDGREPSRRRFLKSGVVLAATLGACQESEDSPGTLGAIPSPYGERSPFEKVYRESRLSQTPEAGSSRTPLHASYGILTPASLHFERHHSGVPTIDPGQHRLLVHGLVDRPLIFNMEEIRRLPSVSRILFLECSGNGLSDWETPRRTVQGTHGMIAGSEWTGVKLSLLLEEAGLQPEGKWIVAEGADACKMHRSLPLVKAMDDVIVAYGQNGEAIRPGQGYPLRLVVPGWEGNTHIKWLRRIKVVNRPYMGREETAKYTDLMPDGTARQFTFTMEAKSVITFPAGGDRLPGPGFYEITGLAWSGRGLIEEVGVSIDGGETWQAAQLQEPRLPVALTRFRFPWHWDGREMTLQARSADESGYLQPSFEELTRIRGSNTRYHNNSIKVWKVLEDGSVHNALA